ncbi:hypothetical protein F4818DRAFT_397175 [Hypoxylon cercidicola]|nr:hypothetical protein F4818DRAFT_397175 [Hypoxylon cercidicola]
MSAFYNYSEPFSCECRAFGHLHEAGYEDPAIKCFGYLLLDEEHETTMMNQFKDLRLEFNGNMDMPGWENTRSRFPGKDDRDPPIRGIVKEFGQCDEPLTTRLAKGLLRDIVRLQELGIFNMDVAHRQIISGKLSDFSTAITVPHFRTSPELNPNLNSDQISAMEFETFQLSNNDYRSVDNMLHEWNWDNNGKIAVYAFPGGTGCQTKRYNLRNKSPLRFYTYVDPRKLGEGVSKRRKRARWDYHCDEARLWELTCVIPPHYWEYKDGYIFPRSII